MRKITSEIEALIAGENIRLNQRQDRLIAGARSSAISNLIASGLALAVMLLGGGLLVRSWWQTTRAQASLAQSEERFRLLVSGVTDYAILMLDPRGLIVSWNDGAERIKGYAATEILGSHISRFYSPGDASAGVPDQLLETAARAGRVEAEGWHGGCRNDGSRFWANVMITALHGTMTAACAASPKLRGTLPSGATANWLSREEPGGAGAIAKDGGARPADRRSCPRLQQ